MNRWGLRILLTPSDWSGIPGHNIHDLVYPGLVVLDFSGDHCEYSTETRELVEAQSCPAWPDHG